jgi:hypothetical protein
MTTLITVAIIAAVVACFVVAAVWGTVPARNRMQSNAGVAVGRRTTERPRHAPR